MILDDSKYIFQRDTQDMLGAAEKIWQQLNCNHELVGSINTPRTIVVFALGGSAAAARLAMTIADSTVPIEICSDYTAPGYVNKDTLCIAMSYSGSTEETIEALDQAKKAGVQVAVITSGGAMLQTARDNKHPYIQLAASQHPRLQTIQFMQAFLAILGDAGSLGADVDLSAITDSTKAFCESVASTVETKKNQAKQLALELAGTTPIIHSGSALAPVAHTWKIGINETAKNVAYTSVLPEFSHNEFIGWTSHPVDKLFSIVDLHSKYDHPRVKKRFSVTEKLLSGQRPHPQTVSITSGSEAEEAIHMYVLGVFVAIYLALLNGVDPFQVDKVADMKQALDD